MVEKYCLFCKKKYHEKVIINKNIPIQQQW